MVRKLTAVAALMFCLVLAPFPASSASTKTPCIFDVLIIRPFGAVGVVAGTVGIAAITPFVFVWPPDGRVRNMYQEHVIEPAKYVFTDALCSH